MNNKPIFALAVAERRLRLGIVTESTLSCLCSRLALPLLLTAHSPIFPTKKLSMADNRPTALQSDPYGENIEIYRLDWRDERMLKWIQKFREFGEVDSKGNIKRQHAIQSGELLRSVKWRAWRDSGGDRQVFEARYNYYAKFVELALGRKMPFKELPPAIPQRKWQPIAMPDRPRKAKPSIPTEMRKQARKFTTMLEDRFSYHGMAILVYALGPSIHNQQLIRDLLNQGRFSQTVRNA